MDILSCGCRMSTDVIDGVTTFIFIPCSETCKNYQYVLNESTRQGKPTTIIGGTKCTTS